MSRTDRNKHPCPDCSFCQWCSDDRCALCLKTGCSRKKLSIAEQIALYDKINKGGHPDCNIDETIDALADFDLTVIQPRSGYRFSIDPLLLCDFVPPGKKSTLDMGTGSGIMPLILARKQIAQNFVGVELQREMADIARRNVSNNGLAQRINIINADIQEIDRHLNPESFELVIANPPYRRRGEGKTSPKPGRDIARHESSATLQDFMTIARRMAQPGGSICFINHTDRLSETLSLAVTLKLSPARLQMIHGSSALPARMFMVELIKGRTCSLTVMPPIYVKDSVYGERQQAGMKKAT